MRATQESAGQLLIALFRFLSSCLPLLHGQARMHGAAITERRELRGERRDRDLGQRLRRPAALAMYHAHRPHMAVERQFAGALVKELAVDMACLFGGEINAERRDRIGAATAQAL